MRRLTIPPNLSLPSPRPLTSRASTALALALFVLLAFPPCIAPAATVTESSLPPSQDDAPILSVHHDGQRYPVSREEIESLGLHEVSLLHFEGLEGRFAGVWLDEFLAAQELDDAPRLRFIAHDDYSVFLTPENRADKRYLLATRLDGEPLTRETFGPTLLIVPEDAEAVAEGSETMTRWIWSIREIHAR